MSAQRKIHFTAGPATLPSQVRKQVLTELFNYKDSDVGILEISHRSPMFVDIRDKAETDLRRLLNVPDNYDILFMPGGARLQFDCIPLNLCPQSNNSTLDYIVSGMWSKMAANDAMNYARVHKQTFDTLPSKDELVDVAGSVYRFYCDNETIEGLEYNFVPECNLQVPLVCDMTSNFLSRPVDVSKYGVIFASCQKNCGIAGLTIVIVREDLIGHEMRLTPRIQNFRIAKINKSMYNTPPTFAIYVAALCFEWALARGGLEAIDELSRQKSGLLYETIDQSDGFYLCKAPKLIRSRMNVVFSLANKQLEKLFLKESEAAGLYDIQGHRLVGGFRASLYHGIIIEDVQRLCDFMTEFRQRYER